MAILLIGLLDHTEARRNKRKCQTTEPACASPVTEPSCATPVTQSSTTAMTSGPLKGKGESCVMNSDCMANLACDVKVDQPTFKCAYLQNGPCSTSQDCANNQNCTNGKCGCGVRK